MYITETSRGSCRKMFSVKACESEFAQNAVCDSKTQATKVLQKKYVKEESIGTNPRQVLKDVHDDC